MRRNVLFASALLAMSVTLYAQSSAVGTWKGETQMPNGARAVILVINGDGTGRFNAGNDNELSGIVIEGDGVSFSFKPIAAGGALTVNMTGNVDGDTLTLRGTFEGGESGPPMVLARQK